TLRTKLLAASWFEYARRRGRMRREGRCGTDRPGHQIAAPVGAGLGQSRLHAVPAERAFKGADHRVRGIGRKILPAPFAVRPQLQHAGRLRGAPDVVLDLAVADVDRAV